MNRIKKIHLFGFKPITSAQSLSKLITTNKFYFLFLLISSSSLKAQDAFNFNCVKDTVISGCSSSCITLKVNIPDLKSQTSDYIVNPISSGSNCFKPYIDPSEQGTSANVVTDDRYSSVVNIGFPFPFFGNNYNQLIISTNGYISFDVSRANFFSHYGILRTGSGSGYLNAFSGTPQDMPSTLYDRALIMGAFQDLNLNYPTSPQKSIQYKVVGTAPYRRWILSFNKMPQYSPACSNFIENTQQIVLYESTGVIEVFVFSRQSCPTWNGGRAMIGIQSFDKTKAVTAPGRKASDPIWEGVNMNESWRFVPAAGSSLLKRVELYDLAGNLISTGTTASSADGLLEASFPNICTPVGTTTFIVRPVYQKIDDATVEIYGSDTVNIIKTAAQIEGNATVTNATCTVNGSIEVNATTGTAPFEFALNGGNFQTSNIFNNLTPGNYILTVKDASGCSTEINAEIELNNDLTLQTMQDTAVCSGASFTANTISNATSFSWSPSAGLNNANAQNPIITPTSTTQYTVTATNGNCIVKDVLNVTVNPKPLVNAGNDAIIIEGDEVQLNATASAGSYLWNPATELSANNILNPIAKPLITTNYSLSVTNAQNCSATDNVTVTVLPYCVKPMEAFTPNGDGHNDVWLINNGNCLKAANVQVFNRYGGVVFQSNDYNNNWNGTYKDKPLPDGTYYYIISYQLINGKTVHQKGNVTILR